jgi:hypothetical protein
MKYAAFIGVLFTGIAMAPLAVAEAPNAYVPRLRMSWPRRS